MLKRFCVYQDNYGRLQGCGWRNISKEEFFEEADFYYDNDILLALTPKQAKDMAKEILSK